MDWFKPVTPELKNALPFGIRKAPTKFGEGTGVSTKKERTRRPSHDGTVYFDPKNNRWIGQLPAVRKWDGTIKRPSVSGGTQAEVLEKLRQLQAKAMSPDAVDPNKLHVRDWVEVYFEEFKEGELSPTTIRDYRSIMDNHVIPAIGDMQLQKINPLHVQRIINTARRQGLSSGRVIKIANTMSSLFAQAKRARLIEYNPASADACTLPKLEPTYNERAPQPDEIAAFWEEAKNNSVALAVCLSLACGFRRGELLGLRWSDVDFDNGQIQVRQTVVDGDGGVCVKGPKSKAGMRIVVVPGIMLAELQRLRETRQKEGRGDKKHLVFCTKGGNRLSPSNFSRSFRKIKEKLGLSNIRFKSFRHGHATLLDEINAPLKVRQERMGHAELKTTLRVYTHTRDSQHKMVADNINAALDGLLNKEKMPTQEPDQTAK